MSLATRVAGAVAGALGLAAAGAAVGVGVKHRELLRREPGAAHAPYGSLRGDSMHVVADDGVDLYVEIDEVTPGNELPGTEGLTLVLVHGFALSMDCWHDQRDHFRGRVRTVLFDQRSHGRSKRSAPEHCRIDQLGRDLRRVIETTTDGPVVVVAHSMGGMALISMGEQFTEMLGAQVVGVGLVSTTAGEIDPARVLLPIVPPAVGASVIGPAIRTLERLGGTVDKVRTWGRDVAGVLTDSWAFGDPVGTDLVDFVTDMIDGTPFGVVADFYPSFDELDLFSRVSVLGAVPTVIVCGTRDRITKLALSRSLHAHIHGSDLVEVPGAGHLVILERPDEVNGALDDLVSLANEHRVKDTA